MANQTKQKSKDKKKWWLLIILLLLLLLLWCFFFGPCSAKKSVLGCSQAKALQSAKEYIQKHNFFDWSTIQKIEVAHYQTHLDPSFYNKEVDTENPGQEVKARMQKYNIYKFIFSLSEPPKGSSSSKPLTQPYSYVIVDSQSCKTLNSTHGRYYSETNVLNMPLKEILQSDWPK